MLLCKQPEWGEKKIISVYLDLNFNHWEHRDRLRRSSQTSICVVIEEGWLTDQAAGWRRALELMMRMGLTQKYGALY